MLKIFENHEKYKLFTCPENIQTHLLRILGALQHLKTWGFLLFSILPTPICDQDTKNNKKTLKISKNKKNKICLVIISTHPWRILRARDI